MEPGNISGWASGEIRESLEHALKKSGEKQSEYVVEAVRQRLEREHMLPHQRHEPSAIERLIEEARATGEMLGGDVTEAIAALRELRARSGRAAARRRSREGVPA